MFNKKRNYEKNQNFPDKPHPHNTLSAENRTRDSEFRLMYFPACRSLYNR